MTFSEAVLAGLVVASGVLVGVVLLVDDDDALPAADARAALDVAIEQADPPSDDRVDIDACPFAGLDAAVEALAPEPDALVDAFQWAFPDQATEPEGITCGAEEVADVLREVLPEVVRSLAAAG